MSFIFINNDLSKIREEYLETEEIPKEYAWDIETGQFIIENGCIPIVEGIEALKIWIYKCLKTVRGRYDAYDWTYGHDMQFLLENHFTRDYIISESKRMTEEAMLRNTHIQSLQNLDIRVIDNTLMISFTVITNFGEIDIKI